MKFSMARGELFEALSVVGRGLSARSTLPILAGILVSVSGDDVVFQSTDLEISIRHAAKGKVDAEGQTVIPGRLMSDIIRSLPESTVTIDATTPDRAAVVCEQSSFTIKTLSPDDYPKFPEIGEGQSVDIPTDRLVTAIRQVGKAVSRDETRAVLTGVLFVIDGAAVRLVATDSYRLAVTEQPLEAAPDSPIEVVVPGRAIEEIPRLAGASEAVSVGVSENQVVFRFGQTIFVSRRIEGIFPNYRQLLPKEKETTFTVPREEFFDAVKRVSILAQHNAPLRMKVAVEEQTLTLSATTQDVGDATEDLHVETTGSDVEIAFNHSYLTDGIASSSSETVVFDIVSPLKPGVMRSTGDEDFTYLIMPVRLG